jgi:hypothetical protein
MNNYGTPSKGPNGFEQQAKAMRRKYIADMTLKIIAAAKSRATSAVEFMRYGLSSALPGGARK